jgi:hypothetical protein
MFRLWRRANLSGGTGSSTPSFQTLGDVSKLEGCNSCEIPLEILWSRRGLRIELVRTNGGTAMSMKQTRGLRRGAQPFRSNGLGRLNLPANPQPWLSVKRAGWVCNVWKLWIVVIHWQFLYCRHKHIQLLPHGIACLNDNLLLIYAGKLW